ncbi:5-hydroxytryptamine receptor 1D-like [Paramacrobiotus metropolitanus]|uniref:5-hydroxytryptamine receptor 1D-like n=1 Tax=Paramacrobiotus metropolitanus TaxID=2943436 RepID=UPI002445C72D|nr:5-hydroxytryptamine receptor 1D-like [Paramacrobiotus metropolitanus]
MPNNTTVAEWDLIPAVEVVVCPWVIVSNTVVLSVFIKNRRMHVPFNVYLFSLLIANICLAILGNPLDIVNFIFPTWWLGQIACDVYLYALYVMSGLTVNSHALITINRLWAMTFPHFYKQYHSSRSAAFLCGLVWIAVHAIILPGVILNARVYRLPIETAGCVINTNAMPVWNTVVQFGVFIVPNIFVMLAYPYILWMRRRRRLVRITNRHVSILQPSTTTAVSKSTKESRAFIVLTVMTASVTVSWTPLNAYYGMGCFMDVSQLWLTFEITQGLFILQPALDPIFFAVTLPELRQGLADFVQTAFRKWRMCKKVLI